MSVVGMPLTVKRHRQCVHRELGTNNLLRFVCPARCRAGRPL